MLSHNPFKPVISDTGGANELKDTIHKAKNGDAKAFEEIYTRVYTPLYRYIYSRTGNKEQADDISQQVFLRFYEALPRYEYRGDEGSLLAYLFTIGKRLIINEGTRKKHIPLDDEMFEEVGDESIDTLSEVHIALLAEKINDYLPLLSDDEEEVIRLFFYAELSHKEIALVLQKEEAGVRKIKERALRKLRTATKHLHD
jgi:RNA polymerase sigma-70 factor (ECF subfamily)